MDLDFLCTSLIIGGFHVLGTVNNVYDMEIWYQFYYVFFFQFSFLFTDGRGLRHKYFKDYKDYLGKWGNVDNLKACTITESEILPICLTWWLLFPWQVPVPTMQ